MNKKEGEKSFSIKRNVKFNGKRKVGLDTNIHIKLNEQPMLLDHVHAKIFKRKNVVYTHATCAWEFARHLTKTEKIQFEEAKIRVKKFFKENNIKIIYPKNTNSTEEEIRQFEKESNEKLKGVKRSGLKCHPPDSQILIDFKKFGINRVISTDESFRICTQFLGMDAESIPSFNSVLRKEMRMIYGYKN